MDTDLVLTLGIVLLIVTIPSLLASWVEGRVPRFGAIMFLTALAMIIAALATRPGGYAFGEIPDVMVAVFSRMAN